MLGHQGEIRPKSVVSNNVCDSDVQTKHND